MTSTSDVIADANAETTDRTAAFVEQMERAISSINAEQVHYRKVRGRAALAHMVAAGYKTISFIHANVGEDVQVAILDQHQLTKKAGANRFTPWINCIWGEVDEKADKVIDLSGLAHPKWVPNLSMSVYFHTMEALAAAGFDANSETDSMVTWIMERGGSQSVANARKRAVAADPDPAIEQRIWARRDLYCEYGPSAEFDLDTSVIKLSDDVATYFTLLVERRTDGKFIARGVVEPNAIGRLNKLADDNGEALLAIKREADLREVLRAEEREKLIAEMRHHKPSIDAGEISGTPNLIRKVMAKRKANATAEAA